MLVKTYEASGRVLDYLVAKAEGLEVSLPDYANKENTWLQVRYLNGYYPVHCPDFCTDAEDSQPILEREMISTMRGDFYGTEGVPLDKWMASPKVRADGRMWYFGPTALIAGLRCHVCTVLGNEYEVPDLLVQNV